MNFAEILAYLKVPGGVALVLIIVFGIIQIIGDICSAKGKIVPEFMKLIVKIREHRKRKRDEKQKLCEVNTTLARVETLLAKVDSHYDEDNIAKRDAWMQNVNTKEKLYDTAIAELQKEMKLNTLITRDIQIELKRNAIINFARVAIKTDEPITREQFNRIYKIYDEYETIIRENNLTNGEVDVAKRLIDEAYEEHMRNGTFLEDKRGF